MVDNPTMDATSASKEDVATIGRQVNYEWLNIFVYNGAYESDQALFSRIDGITAAVTAGDLVVYQYPTLNGPRFENLFIDRMNSRGVNVVIFVHDVELLRGSNVAMLKFDEYSFFNKAAALIVHNPIMAAALQKHGVTKPMVPLYMFDVIDDSQPQNKPSRQLVFAGNINKSPFLGDWPYHTPIKVFGMASFGDIRSKLENNPRVDYRGALYRDKLNEAIGNGLGLVWDVNTPQGNYATYAQYNNPYKLSFYLSHAIPVILSHNAAPAKFITENHLGFVLNELNDIDSLMDHLTDKELAEVTTNVLHLSTLLHSGYFTKRALLVAEQAVYYRSLQPLANLIEKRNDLA
ncbi:hypothetical protein [Schleiferilactobacillus perolens]|jgi:hypothetical protein|uniref:hypothetical protein n=1 Tax=Schleiferilactobacillus perolens TaxID=100468 RepID=UPI002355196C|nr:hypothetical protein [Schleiferilactobacillus perolens]MCI2172561.1 hypothetical protein [Schleiferilactobacillus perolens]